jgi:mono/diheme cytochrome c family protein
LKALVPTWAKKQGYKQGSAAYQGAELFAVAGCANCHTYLGAGASNLGAPDLSSIGKTSNRGVPGFAQYVADPSKFGNNKMPKFAELGDENLRRLGAFLQASQGPK